MSVRRSLGPLVGLLLGVALLPDANAQVPPLRGLGTPEQPWLLPTDPDTLPVARPVWKLPASGMPTVSAELPGLLLVLDDVGEVHRLRVLDTATGRVRWTVVTQSEALERVTPDALVLDEGVRWVARDPRTGKVLWKAKPSGKLRSWQGRLVEQESRTGLGSHLRFELREARTGKSLVKLVDQEVHNVLPEAPWLLLNCAMHGCKVLDRDGRIQTVTEDVYAVGTAHLESGPQGVALESAAGMPLGMTPVLDPMACAFQAGRLAIVGPHGAVSTPVTAHDPEHAADLDVGEEAPTPRVRRRGRGQRVALPVRRCEDRSVADVLTVVQAEPGLGPVAWQFPRDGAVRTVVLAGKEAGTTLAVQGPWVVWHDDRGITAFVLQEPWLAARRPAVPLERDVETWLEAAAGRRPPTTGGDCRDEAPSAEGAAARLDHLEPASFSPVLFRKLTAATPEDLAAWVPWACPQSQRTIPPELTGAWALRWEVLGRSMGPQGWRKHAALGAQCLATAGRPLWWKPMLERVQRQPWTTAWLQARAQAIGAIHEAVPDATASAWLGSVLTAYGRAVPKDRRAGPPLAAWGPLLAETARFVAASPGASATWRKLDAAVAQRGPAAICARKDLRTWQSGLDGACIAEPAVDAWQAGDSGWAVMEAPAVAAEALDLWVFHWQGEQWTGPWYVGPAPWLQSKLWRGPLGPERWTGLEVAAEDEGRQLVWQRLPANHPCDPDQDPAEIEQTWLPLALTWTDAAVDSDGDGWTDRLEQRLGTDPHRADTDGDGVADALDPAPVCARKTVLGPRDAALAAMLRVRTSTLPLRESWNEACFEAPTLGGPLLPTHADDGADVIVRAPPGQGPGLWTVILDTPHRTVMIEVAVAHTAEGWTGQVVGMGPGSIPLLWGESEGAR
jgi:hypothetical protein